LGLVLLLALAASAPGCRETAPPPGPPAGATAEAPWFEDVTDKVGLDFVHDPGPTGPYFMPQIMGSGGALLDYDGDGRLDVYLVHNGGPQGATNRLYHQEKDGTFRDVSKGSGLDVAGYCMGVAVGDVNNDGRPDVLLTEYGRTRLFLNNGDGTFTDVTKDAGLDNPLWGTSACFFDYDRDGWLDLVVVNYLDYDRHSLCYDGGGKQEFCGPTSFPGTVTRLYRNLGGAAGKGVRFEDVTVKSGLGRLVGPGLGVFCGDFNGDRWPDILVANDAKPNHLWINQKDGTFKEEAAQRGLAFDSMGRVAGNMGVAVGDVDGDGLLDVFITHLSEELPGCWKQGPAGQFRDVTTAQGLAHSGWHGTGFGAVFADFDHDGALDLAVANGAVKRPMRAARASYSSAPFWAPYGERNQLFANDGSGKFRDLSAANGPFCGPSAVSRGLAVGDVDGDGALDLLVTRLGGPARLYRNVAPKRGHWLLVKAVDPALGGRDAYGAEVTVRAGPRRWKRWLNPGFSYLSSNDPRVHFGLGEAAQVEAISVVWPDGSEETFPGGAADRRVLLRKGEGRAAGP
jgi:hypothetical protein